MESNSKKNSWVVKFRKKITNGADESRYSEQATCVECTLKEAYLKRYGNYCPSLSPLRTTLSNFASGQSQGAYHSSTPVSATPVSATPVSAASTIDDTRESLATEYSLTMRQHATGWYNQGRIIKMRERVKDTGKITIFISSPFDGCERERIFFMQSCLLELVALCESRGVFLDVVDMRWGITEELTTSNKTIGLCLEGIDDADIFLGYFGARYGSSNLLYGNSTQKSWIDRSIEECSYRYPFVQNYDNVSVTEMEWLHAMTHPDNLLNHSKPVSMFYFRHAKYDEDEATNAKGSNCQKSFLVENAPSKLAHDALRHTVKTLARQTYDYGNDNHDHFNYCLLREDYPFPQLGAKLMKQDCELVIKQVIGDILPPGEFSEWQIPHEAFAKSRLTMYLPFDTALDNATEYLRTARRSESKQSVSEATVPAVGQENLVPTSRVDLPLPNAAVPLVITGPSGGGKSSLMAHLILKEAPSLGHCIFHFCGCNMRSTYLLDLLDHIYSEFVHFVGSLTFSYDCKQFDSLDPNDVFSEIFTVYEKLLAAMGNELPNLYIFVDALNQLTDDVYDEHTTDLPSDMKWFPQHCLLPPGLKLIVSCLPRCSEYSGKMLQALKRCECQFQHMLPADLATRQQIVARWHKVFHKGMDQEIMETVWNYEPCSNPMFLSLTLKQLISNGSWATLRTYRDKLLSASNVPELMIIVITGIQETVYVSTVHRPDIIRSIFQLIYCSREGLSANEIVDIIRMKQMNDVEGQGKPVMDKQACFPILIGLKHLLTCRRGIYNFSHDFVRQAVESLFFCNGTTYADLSESGDTERLESAREEEINVHRLLSVYFGMSATVDNSTLTWEGKYPRPMRELTYHQRKAGVRPSVVVAARLRPFSESGQESICRMKGKQVMLINPKTQKPLVFGLDFAFDSSGNSDSRDYASQERIYKLCGSDIVQQTLEGFNSTVVAYGQTGSGKSYSMFGVKDHPGLIPLTLKEMIRQLSLKSKRDGWRWTATCTMVEIYMDKVRDLLGVTVDPSPGQPMPFPARAVKWSASNPDSTGRAQYLVLSFPPKRSKQIINFSQIAVFSDGKNVAVDKPTISNHDYKNAKSGTAVDGHLQPREWPHVYHSGGCADDFWEVTFSSEYRVANIVFYNRLSCCERSAGMNVTLLDSNRDVVWSSSLHGQSLTEYLVVSCFGEWLVTAPDIRCGSVSWRGTNHDVLLRMCPVPEKGVLLLNSFANGEWGLAVLARLPLNCYPLRFRVVANEMGFHIYAAVPDDDENFTSLLCCYPHRIPLSSFLVSNSSEADKASPSFPTPVGTHGWVILSAGMPWYPEVDMRMSSSRQVEVIAEDNNASTNTFSKKYARFLAVSFKGSSSAKRIIQISQIAAFSKGVNVALHKPTVSGPSYSLFQSSTCVDGVYEMRHYPSIYHSRGGPEDYWEVDFAGEFDVDKVDFYNCIEYRERSAGMVISLLDSDRDVVWSVELKGNETFESFEICKNDVVDVSPTNTVDTYLKNRAKTITLRNVRRREIRSVDDVMNTIREGEAQRHVKATDMNAASSRSHCILTLTVTQTLARAIAKTDVKPLVSKINLVDLAGSERGSKSGYHTAVLRSEAISTNKSLSALNNCIRALIDPASTHVPYRESKLTWMLQDSLGGTAKTVLLATLSPCSSYFDENLATLRYAALARRMPNQLTQDPAAAALFQEAENIRTREEQSRQLLCDKYYFGASHLDLMKEFYGTKSEVSFQWFDVGTICWKSELDRWDLYHSSRKVKEEKGAYVHWIKRLQFTVNGIKSMERYIKTSPAQIVEVDMTYSFYGYNTAICQLQVAVDIYRPIIDVKQICNEKLKDVRFKFQIPSPTTPGLYMLYYKTDMQYSLQDAANNFSKNYTSCERWYDGFMCW